MDAQGETVAVEGVEHVEDVLGAAHEAEHLGDVHGVARPRVRQQLAGLRALERLDLGARGTGFVSAEGDHQRLCRFALTGLVRIS
ncbi:hypothetical protein [Streptomyces puniciscabiei]|uniref:hypothetical protein n=1 Tax=Streptomyces puniciscabiei TaxID=164348 RepID=UPI00379431CE